MLDELQKRLITGYAKFSDGTSLHGFAELYGAKSKMWKAVWFVVSFGAIIVTIYQVNNTVNQYMADSTRTVISSVDENDILYPPVQVCYWHWMYWVDWDKAKSLGFGKGALLYSFKYFNSIYASDVFNISVAKTQFRDAMVKNNFTTFSQLFFSIARNIPVQGDDGIESYFNKTLFQFRIPYLLFCYEITPANLRAFFKQTNKTQKTLSFNVFGQIFEDLNNVVDYAEYNGYMFRWADKSSMYVVQNKSVNLTSFAPPVVLYLMNNMAKGLDLQMDEDAYYVDMHSSVYTWQSKSGKVCDTSKREIFGTNSTCLQTCIARYFQAACTCQRFDVAVLLQDDTIDKVCHKDFVFLSKKPEDKVKIDSQKSWTDRAPLDCLVTDNYTGPFNQCLSQCIAGCQIWHYDQTVTIKQTSAAMKQLGKKNATKVVVYFPKGKDIIVMGVQDAHSWQDFIGSVGGLLGIWTGASIMSLVEVVYLFFFADHEEAGCYHFFFLKWKKKQRKVFQIVNHEPTVFNVQPLKND